jgi:hypothetical protein
MMDESENDIAFVFGAGRSGSTLLYKLLCLHTDVAFIYNYDIRLPLAVSGLITRCFNAELDRKRAAWFSDAGNAYFVSRPLAKRLFPTPVEGENIYARCGIPLHPTPDYRPDEMTIEKARRKFARLRGRDKRKLLVSKRTANNRRIDALCRLFPAARFVHLVRDGRDVAHSLSRVEWWPGHTVWWDGRTAAAMEASGIDRLSIAARNWVRDTEEVNAGLRRLAPERVMTVRYENLVADPLATMQAVCAFLDLPATEDYLGIIDSIGLAPRPAGWRTQWSDKDKALVTFEQRELLASLGYDS